MMSILNGNLRAMAARSVDSLTSLRTTKVPTAPMLTTSNFASSLAIAAGRQRLAPPTFTARRKTTQLIQRSEVRGQRSDLFRRRDQINDVNTARFKISGRISDSAGESGVAFLR